MTHQAIKALKEATTPQDQGAAILEAAQAIRNTRDDMAAYHMLSDVIAAIITKEAA